MANQLMNTLDTNKRRYDRQLYGDYILKVYDHCSKMCLADPFERAYQSLNKQGDVGRDGLMSDQLR